MTWAKRHECCRYCKTTTLPHKGRGLCTFCYRELWRYAKGPKQEQEMAPFFTEIYNEHIAKWRKNIQA